MDEAERSITELRNMLGGIRTQLHTETRPIFRRALVSQSRAIEWALGELAARATETEKE